MLETVRIRRYHELMDMQTESALAGDRRMKASWFAPYAPTANVPGITAKPGQGTGQSPRALLDARLPPGPVPPRMAETLVVAAQPGLIMLQPRRGGSMIHFSTPFRGARAAIFEKHDRLKARVRPANPRGLQREHSAARLADLDRWRR